MTRETHRVAIVVLCEAEGVDAADAAAGAQMAITRALYDGSQDDKQGKVGQVRGPSCSKCGISWMHDDKAPLDEDGNIRRHVWAERWSPEELKRDQMVGGYDEPLQDACEGSGKPPRAPSGLLVGFDRPDGLAIYARVHEVMEAGMAAGNGYLWTQPTWKAFR